MKDVVIVGSGGHAKVVNSVIKFPKKVTYWNDGDYIDRIKGNWVIAIGNNQTRKKIAEQLGDVNYLTIVSDTAITLGINDINEGSQILHGAIVQVGAKIGKHCIVNTAASIDHDCILKDFTFVGPNATLCGGVEIGECSFVGAGAIILPFIKVGKNCTIGAGSIVTKDIPDGWMVYGNPAKKID